MKGSIEVLPNLVKKEDLENLKKNLREKDDAYWKNKIFSCLLSFYKNVNNEAIKVLLANTSYKPEKTLKIYLKSYLENNEDFDDEFNIESEPDSSNNDVEGKYDFKITNTYWKSNGGKGYFPIECKCIYGSDSKKPRVEVQEKDIKEYVFDGKDDGGMYRYLTGKYAYNSNTNHYLNFGGVLGFLLNGNCEATIKRIKEKLENLVINEQKILLEYTPNAIENQEFTFDVKLQRLCHSEPILLHNFIFDFT